MMPDEKPILDYSRPRPNPRPQDRIIEIATSVVLAVAMFSIAIIQGVIFCSDGGVPTLVGMMSMLLLTGFGLLLLRPVWKRR